jgi:hypothetical protein
MTNEGSGKLAMLPSAARYGYSIWFARLSVSASRIAVNSSCRSPYALLEEAWFTKI